MRVVDYFFYRLCDMNQRIYDDPYRTITIMIMSMCLAFIFNGLYTLINIYLFDLDLPQLSEMSIVVIISGMVLVYIWLHHRYKNEVLVERLHARYRDAQFKVWVTIILQTLIIILSIFFGSIEGILRHNLGLIP